MKGSVKARRTEDLRNIFSNIDDRKTAGFRFGSLLRKNKTAETVCLLSKGDVKSQKLRFEFSLEDMDTDGFKKGATYNAIRDWIKEKYGYEQADDEIRSGLT